MAGGGQEQSHCLLGGGMRGAWGTARWRGVEEQGTASSRVGEEKGHCPWKIVSITLPVQSNLSHEIPSVLPCVPMFNKACVPVTQFLMNHFSLDSQTHSTCCATKSLSPLPPSFLVNCQHLKLGRFHPHSDSKTWETGRPGNSHIVCWQQLSGGWFCRQGTAGSEGRTLLSAHRLHHLT